MDSNLLVLIASFIQARNGIVPVAWSLVCKGMSEAMVRTSVPRLIMCPHPSYWTTRFSYDYLRSVVTIFKVFKRRGLQFIFLQPSSVIVNGYDISYGVFDILSEQGSDVTWVPRDLFFNESSSYFVVRGTAGIGDTNVEIFITFVRNERGTYSVMNGIPNFAVVGCCV